VNLRQLERHGQVVERGLTEAGWHARLVEGNPVAHEVGEHPPAHDVHALFLQLGEAPGIGDRIGRDAVHCRKFVRGQSAAEVLAELHPRHVCPVDKATPASPLNATGHRTGVVWARVDGRRHYGDSRTGARTTRSVIRGAAQSAAAE
jgi:hypothetical protein